MDKLVTTMSTATYVDAIYQVGEVRHPGISDIDLLLVVADSAKSSEDPLRSLSATERYLFTHTCLVVPASLAPDLRKHVLLHGYSHLHGTEWHWNDDPKTARALEVQTALEFLTKNLLDLYVQLTYGVLKVRVFLQHLKGLRIDLAILGIEESPMAVSLEHATALIDDWFMRSDRERQVAQMAVNLFAPLRDALADAIATHNLYAPSMATIPIARNMLLERGAMIELAHRGLRLPRLPGLEERQHFNAQHRINRFRLRLPMTDAREGSYYASRFDFLSQAKAFAARQFPAYSAPIPPLFYRAL